MTDDNLAKLAKVVLAGRTRRRRDWAKQDAFEFAMLREMADRGELKIRTSGVTFYAAPAKVRGTPSQRRHWRALLPQGALPQWQMPRELQIIYPPRRNVA